MLITKSKRLSTTKTKSALHHCLVWYLLLQFGTSKWI